MKKGENDAVCLESMLDAIAKITRHQQAQGAPETIESAIMRPLHNSSLRAARSNPENLIFCFSWIASSALLPRNDDRIDNGELCKALIMYEMITIGEAANKLSERVQKENEHVPWVIESLPLEKWMRHG